MLDRDDGHIHGHGHDGGRGRGHDVHSHGDDLVHNVMIEYPYEEGDCAAEDSELFELLVSSGGVAGLSSLVAFLNKQSNITSRV